MEEPKATLRDAPELIAQAFSQLKDLIWAELRLAKSEISRAVSNAGFGIVMLVMAAFLALTAFHALAVLAAIGLVAAGFSVLAAAAIVTATLVSLAILCALIGKARLSPRALKPEKTLKNVRSDIATLKEAARAKRQ